jgi:hypothetical protein
LRAREETRGERFVFTHQPEQKVFRLDGGRSELRGFVASKEDYSPRFLRVAFKHKNSLAEVAL